jgi:hypothetical protein
MRALVVADISFASIVIILTLIFGPIAGYAWLYTAYEQFIVKPLIILGYYIIYKQLLTRKKQVQKPFIMIC